MTTNPIVSVIMTVYNGERYLTQAINSILHQNLRDFEFVIVDDGSDDCTPDILAEAQAADPRIRIITKQRIGRARALNVAWRCAQGKYIANLDADDLAEPRRLEHQLAFLEQHPNVGLLGTACKVLNEVNGSERMRIHPQTDKELREIILKRAPFVHSSVMMPRDTLEQLGGYDENLKVRIDYELWIRIACRYQLANLPDVLVTKRVHSSAYFLNVVPKWEKYKTLALIRWQAWYRLSRPVAELRFVIFDPIRKWLGAWNRVARHSTNQLITRRRKT